MLTDGPEDENEEQGPEDEASVPSVNIRLVERNAEEEKDDTLTRNTLREKNEMERGRRNKGREGGREGGREK